MISYRRHQEHIIKAAWEYLDEHPRGIGKKLLKSAEKFFGSQSARHKNEKRTLAKFVTKNFKLRIVPGKVFSFRYGAKWANKLPYYDRYPFVLILSRDVKTRTFNGLNLHYIEPFYRRELLKFIEHLYTQGMDRYYVKDFFGDIAKWARNIARPCLHTYRVDRVMNLKYWNIPTLLAGWTTNVADQTFIRSGIARVWIDSRKKMFRGSRWRRRQSERKKSEQRAREMAKRKMARKNAVIRMLNQHAKKKAGQNGPRTQSATSRKSKARTGKRYGK